MQLKLTCPRGKIGVREAIFSQEDSLLSGTVCWNESGLAHEEYRRLPAVPERVQNWRTQSGLFPKEFSIPFQTRSSEEQTLPFRTG